MRLDDLAREAGVPTTTVRLYQNKGLLHGPRLVGRTGYYDEGHLARLRLIARLQEQGFSLAAIARVLETWEGGRDLADLVGAEEELGRVLHPREAVVLDAGELLAAFPAGSMTPELVQRAASMGLVSATDDGRFRIPDRRFLEAGATLMALGVPGEAVLDEWAHLARATDGIARRFLKVFEEHLLGAAAPDELAGLLPRLHATARLVVAAALDASIVRQAAKRLGPLDDGRSGDAV
ncbi:MAG TPA: MerR family transcriptional regulator [Acidimicrobiales bacterium]|nr:MerR family transcriptional regulator [Acidimicrobiales bacterium]